jgi:hypothetical protein
LCSPWGAARIIAQERVIATPFLMKMSHHKKWLFSNSFYWFFARDYLSGVIFVLLLWQLFFNSPTIAEITWTMHPLDYLTV